MPDMSSLALLSRSGMVAFRFGVKKDLASGFQVSQRAKFAATVTRTPLEMMGLSGWGAIGKGTAANERLG